MPRLILLEGGSALQVNLPKLPFVIGRAPGCDMVLDQQQVSRSHAVIEAAAGGVQLRDLGSNNGSLVNGQRVDTHLLRNGDEVELGGCRIRFLSSSGAVSPDEALRLVTIPGQLSELDLSLLGAPSKD